MSFLLGHLKGLGFTALTEYLHLHFFGKGHLFRRQEKFILECESSLKTYPPPLSLVTLGPHIHFPFSGELSFTVVALKQTYWESP